MKGENVGDTLLDVCQILVRYLLIIFNAFRLTISGCELSLAISPTNKDLLCIILRDSGNSSCDILVEKLPTSPVLDLKPNRLDRKRIRFVVRSIDHLFRYEVSIKRQLSKGSYTKASNTAIKLSLLRCNTDMTLSHVRRYVPSIPVTSMAFINIRVNRNGIFSGNFSRSIAT